MEKKTKKNGGKIEKKIVFFSSRQNTMSKPKIRDETP